MSLVSHFFCHLCKFYNSLKNYLLIYKTGVILPAVRGYSEDEGKEMYEGPSTVSGT